MSPAVVVLEDTPVREVAGLMLDRHVQGVLVTDPHQQAVGILTVRQLTLEERYLTMASVRAWEFSARPLTRLDQMEAACVAAEVVTARDVMEKRLTCARADEPVGVVVARMLRTGAEYAVVHEGTAVVGMLGASDLLRALAGRGPHRAAGARRGANELEARDNVLGLNHALDAMTPR
jgi:CBS domain-containing protein